ncbi:MAG: hypothetical protein MUF00_14995 [Gemmatimonadaceae bacterium]|jgi:hypothetical protein|nr:hypothetical protein [Gemmatimonadaceae bacterium]
MTFLLVRLVASVLALFVAGWWMRRTMRLAPTAAPATYRRGVACVGAGLAGYLLLFTWYGVLGDSSIALRALLLMGVVLVSVIGLGLLTVARRARLANGERARPIY